MEICERGLVDYVAMDIKHSPEKYEDAVGISEVSMDRIKKSVDFLLEGSVDYEFRTTLVKGIHTYEDMDEIASWIHGAKRYYLQNFRDSGSLIGTNNPGCSMESFSEKELMEFKKRGDKKLDVMIRNV